MIFNGLERKDNSDPQSSIIMNLPNLAQQSKRTLLNNEVDTKSPLILFQ